MSDVAAPDGTIAASGVIRRFSWGLGDQMLSSATNFMLGALVARAVDPRDFGVFSLVYATYTLSLGASRAVFGDPLVVRFSSVPHDRWREGVQMAAGSALTVGSIIGLGCIVAALLLGGSLTVLLVILGISFPALLLQDTWRYAFFAHGRGSAAFLNDLAWAAIMFAAFGLLMNIGLSTVGWFTAAWACGGIVAAVVGLFQLRIAPSGPSSALRWLHLHRDLVPRFFAEFTLTSGALSLILFGIGSLTSLAELGQLRAGQIALGPLNILFLGAGMATVPEGVRLLRESPRRLMYASRWASVAMASGVALWGAVVLTLPSDIGRFALGRNWENARSLVFPLTIAAVGSGLSFGATTGLRSLAAARRSLRAKSIDASANLILVLSAASLGGAQGAAWGFAVAGCLRVPTAWWQFTRAMHEYEAGLVPKVPRLNEEVLVEPGDDRAVRPRILVVAYACEPGAGSESGAGWVWPRMLARIADVWVVTRANNRGAIEEALPLAPERDHLRFVYVDLSEKLRFWKKGNRGARLYYMVWQGMVLREARRIDAEVSFDAVWHLTMSTVWLGSLAPLLRKRFILGPVGGGVGTPWRLAPSLGVKGAIYDAARGAARVLARYANPLARLAWRRAELILAQNPETRDWLPARVRRRVEVFPHIVLDDSSTPMDPPITASHPQREGHVAIYAGRLLPWKGVSLAIRALPLLPDWQLLLCGTGPDAGRLRDIASDAGVDDRVTFLGWIPRPDLLRLMHERGDVFVFPSLHDEGGWVIAEALACGLPVVCLDRGGPRVLAGAGVPIGTVSNTIAALASAVEQAALDGPGKPPPVFDDASGRLAQLLSSRLGLGSMPDANDLRDEIAHG